MGELRDGNDAVKGDGSGRAAGIVSELGIYAMHKSDIIRSSSRSMPSFACPSAVSGD